MDRVPRSECTIVRLHSRSGTIDGQWCILNVAPHKDRPSPGPHRRPAWVVLYRRDYSVQRLELSRAEYDLLRAIVDGAPLGEALTTAAASKSPRQQAKVFRWFRTWISEGLFTAIEF